MKQMTLFDAFKKKGSDNIKPQQKDINDGKQKNQGVVASNKKQNDNFNKKVQSTPNTSLKKKNKMTLDSDDQLENGNNESDEFEGYQKVQQQEQKEAKKEKPSKRSNKKILKKQQDQQMIDEGNEEVLPSKTKNKTQQKQIQKGLFEQKNNEEENPLSQFTDATPKWAQKQYCKDAQKRTPDHPNYDPTTLYIPQSQWSGFTAPMKQFWRIKSQNYDKIVLFKLGKFYELFYDDAAVGNKYLDLKYMGTKMHTGFPERSLEKYADELVRLGFKTVIVQQMQTPDQMNQRVKNEKKMGKKPQKTISREVTQILTKGTMPPRDEADEIYLPNYLMSVRIHHNDYAFSLLQIGTNQISMGIVQGLQNFKTVLYQTRPVEVVYDPDNVPNQVCRLMEKSFLQIQMSKVANNKNVWHPLTAVCQIQRIVKQGNIRKPKMFEKIDQMNETSKNLLYSTISGMFEYLKKVFRFDYVICTARFSFFQKNKRFNPMILDSQALQHLEIFQTADGSPGSLFDNIDRTKTSFGKRLLRRWIMSPLTNTLHLNERLNALQDLQQIVIQRKKMAEILKKLPDLQKKGNKLYHYSIKTTNASKAVYFENIHENRLKQFRQFMEKLEYAWQGIMKLNKISNTFKSSRLKMLVSINKNEGKVADQNDYYNEEEEDQSEDGILPNILQHLQEFRGYVKWNGNVPIPQKGLVQYYDKLQDQIDRIKQELDKYLDSLRYELNEPNLNYVHTKERYQIEMPEKSEKRRPKDFQFSSKKSGYSRYLCPRTKQLVKQLEKAQQNLKQQLGLFVAFFFEQFKKKHPIWHKFIQILAELDCLISLSQYSFQNQKSRPLFKENSEFYIKEAKHPCLTNIDFIPNDIVLNNRVMLLTGPNMGGKSTILRTACTLALLAQIGCYVPAAQYKCSPVDRIFTRIGASDKLQLGKSTFFIQMQETKNILAHATNRSLAIVDQLGRGTSTFDGLAIAYSVLKDITDRIHCFCIFATHYHVLLEQFKNHRQVSLKKMDCMFKQPSRAMKRQEEIGVESEIIFLYKLVDGNVDKSFGISIAKKVGISTETIEVALKKAEEMNMFLQSKKKGLLKKVFSFLNTENVDHQEISV